MPVRAPYSIINAITHIRIYYVQRTLYQRRVFISKRRKRERERKSEPDAIVRWRGSTMIVSFIFFSRIYLCDRLIFNSYVKCSSSSLFYILIKREMKDSWQTLSLMNVKTIILFKHHSISVASFILFRVCTLTKCDQYCHRVYLHVKSFSSPSSCLHIYRRACPIFFLIIVIDFIDQYCQGKIYCMFVFVRCIETIMLFF